MGIAEKSIHPLERHGTTQRERLLKALIPENLLLDDRNIADLLAFANKYGEQLNFWNSHNQIEGDWSCFWEKDTTAILAIIATIDLDQIRVQYRDTEFDFVRACRSEKRNKGTTECEKALEKLPSLVIQIYDLAILIQKTCEKLPEKHPIKAEIQALICEKLGIKIDATGAKNFETPLAQLIGFHKSIVNDPRLVEKYKDFTGNTSCQQAWGLTEHDFLTCIEYKEPINAGDRDSLWKLFLAFFKVLSLLVLKAEKAFQNALHGRHDHPPHIALFLSFSLLFRRYHQTEMNGLLARHLIFYYRDVLRLQERREIPDRVHIVFEIAQNLETYRIEKDTLLMGGKDKNGIDLLYNLADELVINKAKLVEKQSLYFYKLENLSQKDNFLTIPIALPVTDMKDGVKVPFAEGSKMWNPLSGLETFRTQYYKKNQAHFEFNSISELFNKKNVAKVEKIKKVEQLIANPGLIISSPELWMDKSAGRLIVLSFDKETKIKDNFYKLSFKISTNNNTTIIEKSSENVDTSFLKLTETLKTLQDTKSSKVFLISANNNDPKIGIAIFLTSDFAAITPLKADKTNPLSQIDQPFVLIQMNDGADYEDFKALSFTTCEIKTSTRGLKNLSIQLGSTAFSPTSEIPLVGSTTLGDTKLSLYVIAPELSAKNVDPDPILNLPLSESNGFVSGISESAFTKKFQVQPLLKLKTEDFDSTIVYKVNSAYSYFKKDISIKASDNNQPIKIIKIPSESISVDYDSTGFTFNANNDDSLNKLYWYDFLGGYSLAEKDEKEKISFIPQNTLPNSDTPLNGEPIKYDDNLANGNLRLGFEDLKAGQSLSLLFHFADGTGNPDHIAPDEIVWSYQRANDFVRIPPQYILLDETEGLRQTGIVKLQIPSDINNENTLSLGKDGRTDLFWLQASASEVPDQNIFIDALPMLIDIYPQAGTAVFQNNNNDLAHIEKGLPAESIAQLRFRDVNISQVKQPFTSFDGRFSENGDRNAYYRRISERLRHKQRAITVWDYEHLTLEHFPKVAIAKCLTHTQDTNVESPYYVTMGVVPFPEKMIENHKYYPIFDAGVLETIEKFLNKHNSYFVSQQGGGVVCCCAATIENDCGCHHENGHLLIRNAIFEPIRLQVCVKFRIGKDIYFYKKQLNEDLKIFLAPWATDGSRPLLFGAKIYTIELLRFLENLAYIDVVMGIKIKHFPNREASENAERLIDWEEPDVIQPFTSRSVLTTYLDVLNEDNPNVLDHEINVIKTDICCDDCKENKTT